MNSSFITSGPGPGFLMGWLCLTEIEADGLSVDLSACSVNHNSSLFSKPNYEIIILLLLRKNSYNLGKYITVKSVLSGHSESRPKIGFQDRLSSIAECSLGAFCNTFDHH